MSCIRTACALDLAIAVAIRANKLRVVVRDGIYGTYWSIEDQVGVIRTALSEAECNGYINAVRQRCAL